MKSSIERFCYFLCYESEVVKSTNFNHLRNLKKNFPCDVLRTRCRWNVFFLLKWRRASFFREFSSIFFLSFGAFSGFFFPFFCGKRVATLIIPPPPRTIRRVKKKGQVLLLFFDFLSPFSSPSSSSSFSSSSAPSSSNFSSSSVLHLCDHHHHYHRSLFRLGFLLLQSTLRWQSTDKKKRRKTLSRFLQITVVHDFLFFQSVILENN